MGWICSQLYFYFVVHELQNISSWKNTFLKGEGRGEYNHFCVWKYFWHVFYILSKFEWASICVKHKCKERVQCRYRNNDLTNQQLWEILTTVEIVLDAYCFFEKKIKSLQCSRRALLAHSSCMEVTLLYTVFFFYLWWPWKRYPVPYISCFPLFCMEVESHFGFH